MTDTPLPNQPAQQFKLSVDYHWDLNLGPLEAQPETLAA